MIKEELRDCCVAAVTLKSISKLGLLVILTIPIILLLFQNHILMLFDKSFLFTFLFTGLLVGIKAWHLYFDAKLLKGIANENFILSDVDKTVSSLFHKKLYNKTLEVRIKSCFRLAKVFFYLLALHFILFLSIILRCLFIF